MSDREQHKVSDEIRCPICQAQLNGAENVDDGDAVPPSPGDVSVCAYCSFIGVFEGDPVDKIVAPDQDALDALLENEDVIKSLVFVRLYQQARGETPPPTNQHHSSQLGGSDGPG